MEFQFTEMQINVVIWFVITLFLIKIIPKIIADQNLLFTFGFSVCSGGIAAFSFADGSANMGAANILGTSSESRWFYRSLAVALVLGCTGIGFIIEEMGVKSFFSVKNWLRVSALIGVIALSSSMTLISRSADFALNEKGSKVAKVQESNAELLKYLAVDQLEDAHKTLDMCRDEYKNINGKRCTATLFSKDNLFEQVKEQTKAQENAVAQQSINIKDALNQHSPFDGQLIQMLFIIGASFVVPIANVVLSGGMFYCWRRLIAIHKKKDRNIMEDESTITANLWPSGAGTKPEHVPEQTGTRAGTKPEQRAKKRKRSVSVSDQLATKISNAAVEIARRDKKWPTIRKVRDLAKSGNSETSEVLKRPAVKKRITAALAKSKSGWKLVG